MNELDNIVDQYKMWKQDKDETCVYVGLIYFLKSLTRGELVTIMDKFCESVEGKNGPNT